MNVENQISRLESLLAKIRGNAAKPRQEPAREAAPAPARAAEVAPVSALPQTTRAEVAPVARVISEPPLPLEVEAAAPAELEELDMMDSEIVELGTETAAASPVETFEADLTVEEPVPESAPRPAAQAAPEELERDVPVKTPPPESGRQVMQTAPPPSFAPVEADLTGGQDVDSLLEADLSGGAISKVSHGVPTMEQLGDTVELEGADAPPARLELVHLAAPGQQEAPLDELELALPKKEFAGAYEQTLEMHSDAAADLRRKHSEPPREASFAPPVPSRAPAPVHVPSQIHEAPPFAGPLVVERPHLEAAAAEIVVEKQPRLPETFLELLDASLSLTANR